MEISTIMALKGKLTGAGRVAFLAQLEKFREHVNAGWPLTVIYENYGGASTGLSYSQFARYVGKHIRPPSKRGIQGSNVRDEMPPPAPAIPAQDQSPSPVPKISKAPKKENGFQHNPNSGNERDDLI
ncbi:TraK family protein [Rhodospirillum rubrum]|uniref:TraK family protein n=1 Tax=Rhodospirillum rubrum TaxID=1085 RepID=UPI001ED8C13B|nr:TraK family protein [Rhodospirillum rubrum]